MNCIKYIILGLFITFSGVAQTAKTVVSIKKDQFLINGELTYKGRYWKEHKIDGYQTMPIVFNEDDHYDFDQENCNMMTAVKSYASWGFFDFRRDGEKFNEGFQTVPVDWSINSDRKRGFFEKVKEITGY